MSSNSNCLNCFKALDGASNFCSNCGQKTSTHRLTLHDVFHDVLHFFTHADKGIIHLIKGLATRPGIIAKEYIHGKRKKIFNPLNFFLITIGLFVFAQTNFRPMERKVELTEIRAGVMEIKDPVVRERRLKKLDRREVSSTFMAKYSNIINFIVTPLIAFFFYCFFRKSGFNYTEHLIINLFLAGFSALVFVFIVTPFLLTAHNSFAYLAVIIGFLLFEVIYRSIAYKQVMNKTTTRGYLYCLLVSFLTVVLWFIVSTSLVQLYVNTGFVF